MNDFELHPERLATTDEQGRRVYINPADVRGRYRTRRNWLQFFLVIFFLALPWLRLNGQQALLLDVAHRQFNIFGLYLRAHNFPLFFFVLAIAGFTLFFVTAIWGRIWCGWACPQTVFIDGVFRRIERLVEGPALKRRALDAAPWTAAKLLKRTLKWALYTAAALVITHSFLAYFVGTTELAKMILRPPSENWTSFLFIVFSTGIILFDFGWFREQFCIIACPYGRFQSVLMDEHSTIVTYDPARGEPRATPQAKTLAKNHGGKLGDCVNCYRCVQVCPTGIDIRRGVQMECIACTACVDACDEVMTKLKKPTGLIRYDSLQGLQNKPRTRLRPRTAFYLSIVLISAFSLIFALYSVKPVDVQIFRAKEAPYSEIKTDSGSSTIVNHFKVELSNQSGSLRHIRFALDESSAHESIVLVIAQSPLPLNDGQLTRADLFVRFPKTILQQGQRAVLIRVHDQNPENKQEEITTKEITLVGPFE